MLLFVVSEVVGQSGIFSFALQAPHNHKSQVLYVYLTLLVHLLPRVDLL